MPKFTKQDVASGFSDTDNLETNFSNLETFSDTCLSRDGTGPNTMEADLDMNENQILNVAQGTTPTDAINYKQLLDETSEELVLGSWGTHNYTSDADLTLTGDEWRYRFHRITDTGTVLTTGRSLVWPADRTAPQLLFRNDTAQTITVKSAAPGATGVAIPAGQDRELFFDSVTGDIDRVNYDMSVDLAQAEADIDAIEAKTDYITVTQAVNLDTMESDIATNDTDIDNIRASIYDEGDTIINFSSDANLTLTAAQQRARALVITDSGVVLTTGRDVIYTNDNDCPAVQYVVNFTAQDLTLTPSAGAGTEVVVPAGQVNAIVFTGIGGTWSIAAVNDYLYVTSARGVLTKDVGGDNGITLTANESLYKHIEITDTGSALTGAKSLIISTYPTPEFFVTNSTAYNFTIKKSGGSNEVVVKPNQTKVVKLIDSGDVEHSPMHDNDLKDINFQTGTTYSFLRTDAGKMVDLSNAGAITATVEPDSTTNFPIGAQIKVREGGAGTVTITAGAGVTLNVGTATAAIGTQYDQRTITKVAANTWTIWY